MLLKAAILDGQSLQVKKLLQYDSTKQKYKNCVSKNN